jgi:hypothetical protein
MIPGGWTKVTLSELSPTWPWVLLTVVVLLPAIWVMATYNS